MQCYKATEKTEEKYKFTFADKQRKRTLIKKGSQNDLLSKMYLRPLFSFVKTNIGISSWMAFNFCIGIIT